MKHIKKLLTLCLTLALVLSLAACGKQEEQPPETTPASYRIAALKGPTAMGLVKLMQDAAGGTVESGNTYDFTLAGSADEVTPALIKGELDMACVPANLAAVLYGKTEGAVEVLAVNTLGVLYIVENGSAVQSIADLKGQTIVAAGKGSTPVEHVQLREVLVRRIEHGRPRDTQPREKADTERDDRENREIAAKARPDLAQRCFQQHTRLTTQSAQPGSHAR